MELALTDFLDRVQKFLGFGVAFLDLILEVGLGVLEVGLEVFSNGTGVLLDECLGFFS